jgi:hypothetical protein
MSRADQLNAGDVIDYRGFPATVQSVSVGQRVTVIIEWQEDGSTYFCHITYPLLTAEEWNSEWLPEDFAARLESDLEEHQLMLVTP